MSDREIVDEVPAEHKEGQRRLQPEGAGGDLLFALLVPVEDGIEDPARQIERADDEKDIVPGIEYGVRPVFGFAHQPGENRGGNDVDALLKQRGKHEPYRRPRRQAEGAIAVE